MNSGSTLLSTATELFTGFLKKNKGVLDGPPRLSSPVRFPHGGFRFKIHAAPGIDYQVLASTDLHTWAPVATGTAASEDVEYFDTEAYKFSFRFYRVMAAGKHSTAVVGYAAVLISPGFSMIGNPLNAPSNAIQALLPDMPDGMTLSKFDTKLYRLKENSVKNGQWQVANDTLAPGEGALIFNPTSDFKTLNFVGEVIQGSLLNPIPAGFSMRSSMVPQPGRLNTDLQFPLGEGDVIHVYDKDKQDYVIYDYPSKAWDSSPPVIGVGEAFWVGKKSPGNWTRTVALSDAG